MNPSYLTTCGGTELEAVTGDPRWARLATDGIDLVAALAEEGLPPDWAILDDDGRAAAGGRTNRARGSGPLRPGSPRASRPGCPTVLTGPASRPTSGSDSATWTTVAPHWPTRSTASGSTRPATRSA